MLPACSSNCGRPRILILAAIIPGRCSNVPSGEALVNQGLATKTSTAAPASPANSRRVMPTFISGSLGRAGVHLRGAVFLSPSQHRRQDEPGHRHRPGDERDCAEFQPQRLQADAPTQKMLEANLPRCIYPIWQNRMQNSRATDWTVMHSTQSSRYSFRSQPRWGPFPSVRGVCIGGHIYASGSEGSMTV